MRLGFSNETEFYKKMTAWACSPFRGNKSISEFERKHKMCTTGRELFNEFCKDPVCNYAFLVHIEQTKTNGGCLACREVFFRYLESETNTNGHLHLA